jgi:hypothetical protein
VKEGGAVESGAARMVCGRDDKEGGGGLLNSGGRRNGSGGVGRNNVGADGHAGMVDGRFTAPPRKSARPLTSVDQKYATVGRRSFQ